MDINYRDHIREHAKVIDEVIDVFTKHNVNHKNGDIVLLHILGMSMAVHCFEQEYPLKECVDQAGDLLHLMAQLANAHLRGSK